MYLKLVLNILALLFHVGVFEGEPELRLKFPIFKEPHLSYHLSHLGSYLFFDNLITLVHL